MTALAARLSAGALQPLDDLRRLCLRTVSRVPALRRVLSRRESRVPVLLTAHALVAFALAVLAPSLLLALGPIVLGVPHIASDVRHLVLKRALPHWWRAAIWVFAGALIAIRVLEEAGVLPSAPLLLEHAVGAGAVLLGGIAGARAGGWRRAAVLSPVAAIAVVALALPDQFRLVFVHGHNLLAIAIWLLLFRRGLRRAWLPVAVVLIAATLLASGAMLRTTIAHGALSVAGLHLFVAADWLAPGLSDDRAIGLTMAFAFLQSVHYAIWLVAIPQEDGRDGSTFRQAGRQWTRDFSRPGAGVIVALCLVVVMAAAVSLLKTRNMFLSLTTFHGWLELALLAFFAGRGTTGMVQRQRDVRVVPA